MSFIKTLTQFSKTISLVKYIKRMATTNIHEKAKFGFVDVSNVGPQGYVTNV